MTQKLLWNRKTFTMKLKHINRDMSTRHLSHGNLDSVQGTEKDILDKIQGDLQMLHQLKGNFTLDDRALQNPIDSSQTDWYQGYS